MKASLVLTAVAASVGFCGAALAEENCRTVSSCRANYENCLMASGGTPAQCKMLYQAALKDGGRWGSPNARAVSKTIGDEAFCHVDF